jgi:glyoxylase-like metal-dependent hydrolase (beta-lactamase superfamily II)
MRITNLIVGKSPVYTSNAYLILGDWSVISDVNTLIDTGSDPGILERIASAPTGVGKRSVEQVLLTHGHSDHSALLPILREKYQPVVYAYSAFTYADVVVKDGQVLQCGDRYFEVIHTPGHSNDSICLYCTTDGVLFVGDTSVVIRTIDGTYEDAYVAALERLCRLDVHTIYSGHDAPLLSGAKAVLQASLRNVRIANDKRHGR